MKTLFAVIACVIGLLGQAGAAAPAEEPPATPPGTVYIIPIRDMIEPALLYVIRRGVQEAEQSRADAIIFIMDTPGGTLDAARDIVRTIQEISVPTYTFVEKDAFSAGAIIALATKHIYMAPGSVIGDAMPIMMTPFGGVQEANEGLEEKMASGVAALARAAAEQGGHDPELAEAMVRRDREFKIGDKIISPKGQLLTLTNVEAAQDVPGADRPLLSAGTVKNLEELLQTIGRAGARQKELEVTGAERIARFVAGLAPIFLIVGLLGIYIEIKTPGFGLPGIVGGVSLAIFFWGHHIAGLAGMEDLAIFLIGTVLLLVELLLIPGFGLVGAMGILLMAWGLLSAMVQNYPGTPWYQPNWEGLQDAGFNLSLALIGAGVLAGVLGKYVLPRTALVRHMILEGATRRSEGYAASASTDSLLGAEGDAITQLRPAGSAMFGDRRLDVVTRGEFLQAGRRVRVVETHGSRVVVEALEPQTGDRKA